MAVATHLSKMGVTMPVRAVVGANWGDEGKGKVTDYLASGDDAKIHRALSQVDDRIVNKVPDVEQFFPRVIELSTHESAVIRIAAAFVMSDARDYEGFAAPLRAMLGDTNLDARLQAACGLARRGEGRPGGQARCQRVSELRVLRGRRDRLARRGGGRPGGQAQRCQERGSGSEPPPHR